MVQESGQAGPEHVPVLLEEAIHYLDPKPGAILVDCTVGYGGHFRALLSRIGPAGRLIGIDRDRRAVRHCRQKFDLGRNCCTVVHGNFCEIRTLLGELKVDAPDGFLVDLGVSRAQLSDPERGFSFSKDGPLDMRMDPEDTHTPTAGDLVNTLPEKDLRRILREYGEEPFAARIAKNIVAIRQNRPFETTAQLAKAVRSSIPFRKTRPRHAPRKGSGATARLEGHPRRIPEIDPATKTFQALRIAVNGELETLEAALDEMVSLLKIGGRLVVIAFHSLEDRIVKSAFRRMEKGCVCPPGLPVCACGRKPVVRILTRKPISPGPEEVRRNLSSRSAKLRAVERI